MKNKNLIPKKSNKILFTTFVLTLLFSSFLLTSCSKTECEYDCDKEFIINVSTGIDNNGNALAILANDPNWVYTAVPTGAGTIVKVCPSIPINWESTPVAVTNARWVNATGITNNSIVGNYTLERIFTIPANTRSFKFDFRAAFDDFTGRSIEIVDPMGNATTMSVALTSLTLNILTNPIVSTFNNPMAGSWKIRARLTAIDPFSGILISGNIKYILPCN